MSVSWIEVQGKKVLYTDYRGIANEGGILDLLDKSTEIIKKTPGRLLILTDFRDTNIPSSFMTKIKQNGKEIGQDKFEKQALLGISGMKKVLLKAYVVFTGHNIRTFDSEEQARQYLAA